MDTKFCYYNNYNVNQPRHFCKNCQRYWTSGGTMRNVPIGSGRRKNKNAVVPNFRHIMVSDHTLQAPRADSMNGIHLSSLKPNGFLMFGSDKPLCGSITSNLNLAERSQNCVPNKFCENSSAPSDSTEIPWPCPWNSVQLPSGFPVSFYPATAYWGSAVLVSSASSSSPTSTLGKHSREGTIVRPSNMGQENLNAERSVLIPKTLRIHDPNEAAKSSIWSTLGIKNEKIGSLNGTGLFKAFDSKGDRHNSIDNMTMVLQANPAALSRSLNFRESA